MNSFKFFIHEFYWLIAITGLSYIVVSLDSGFNPADSYRICEKSTVVFSNFLVILQLAGLIFLVKILFNRVMKMQDERTKLILLPVIILAVPVSLVILWFKLLGC
jgi:hypothetical protein